MTVITVQQQARDIEDRRARAGKPCPICGNSWDDHNMDQMSEAEKIAADLLHDMWYFLHQQKALVEETGPSAIVARFEEITGCRLVLSLNNLANHSPVSSSQVYSRRFARG